MQGAAPAIEPRTPLNAVTTCAVKSKLITMSRLSGKSMSALVNEAIVLYFAHLGVPA